MSKKQTKVAVETAQEDCEMHYLPIDQIIVDNYRQEVDDDKIADLAQNIKEHGLLQEPAVYLTEKGYQLIYGKRRTLACLKNGETTILVKLFNNMTSERAEELALIENCQREQPSEADTFAAVEGLHKNGRKIPYIAKTLGVTELYVRRMIAIANGMNEELRTYFKQGKFDLEVAAIIASATEHVKLKCIERIKESNNLYKINVYTIKSWSDTNYLDAAEFDLKDATLNPTMGKCTGCSYNTKANPILSSMYDKDDGPVCTNNTCFEIKESVHQLRSFTNNPLKRKEVYVDAEYKYPEDFKLKLIGLGFTFREVKTDDFAIVDYENSRLEIEREDIEKKVEGVCEYLNGFVSGYLDSDDVLQFDDEGEIDMKASKKSLDLIDKFIAKADQLIKDLPDTLVLLAKRDFVGASYAINLSHLKEIDALFKHLDVERISDEEEESMVAPTSNVKSVTPAEIEAKYADPVAAEKTLERIERADGLFAEKLAHYLKFEAPDTFTERLNFATDLASKDALTDQEMLAFYTVVASQSGYNHQLEDLYKHITKRNELESSRYNDAEMARLAVENPRFRNKLMLAFIYHNLLSPAYAIDLNEDNHGYKENAKVGYEAAISFDGVDSSRIKTKTQELRDLYDKKKERMHEKLKGLEKPEVPEEADKSV